jgi:thiol-disulfide isomerase/thioredoxin
MPSYRSIFVLTLLALSMWGRELAHSAEQVAQAGIGVALKINAGKVFVGAVLPNTSAAESNAIKPNDQIFAIGEGNKEPVEVAGMNMAKVVGLLRGPKGTVVRLTIVPAGKGETDARVVSMTRGDVKLLNVFGDGKHLQPGAKAPAIIFTRLSDGKKGELSQYLDRVVVLDVWASWCKPCVQNTERLETLKTEHPEWNGRVEFLAVSADDDSEAAAKLWKAHKWTKITCVWTGPSILKACHLSGLPGALIIDEKGVVVTNDLSDIRGVLTRLLSSDSK